MTQLRSSRATLSTYRCAPDPAWRLAHISKWTAPLCSRDYGMMGKQVMDSTDQAARPGRVGSAAGNSVLDTPSHTLQRSGAGCVWLAELSARAPPRRSLRMGGGPLGGCGTRRRPLHLLQGMQQAPCRYNFGGMVGGCRRDPQEFAVWFSKQCGQGGLGLGEAVISVIRLYSGQTLGHLSVRTPQAFRV